MCSASRNRELHVSTSEDILLARREVASRAEEIGFRGVEYTKLLTAFTELARNAVDHGGGGRILVEEVREGDRIGLRLTFEDRGPGIPDIERAMTDGFSTLGRLGLGLGGSRRLMDEFAIESTPGAGTRVRVTKWI